MKFFGERKPRFYGALSFLACARHPAAFAALENQEQVFARFWEEGDGDTLFSAMDAADPCQ